MVATISVRGSDRARALRSALQQVPGLRLDDGHRGWLRCGRRRASLCVESLDGIRVVLELDAAPEVPWEVQPELPGNLRFARSGSRLYAVADLHTAPAQLAGLFEALSWGLARVAGRRVPRHCPGHGADAGAVQTALDGMGWAEGEVVVRERGWELRPAIGGRAVPVQVRVDPAGLRLQRAVLESIPEQSAADAVTDQALRSNARLRWARLTTTETGLVAEACLPGPLVTPRQLAQASRAVAAAAHHAAIPLAILARAGQVAGRYVAMFVNKTNKERQS